MTQTWMDLHKLAGLTGPVRLAHQVTVEVIGLPMLFIRQKVMFTWTIIHVTPFCVRFGLN